MVFYHSMVVTQEKTDRAGNVGMFPVTPVLVAAAMGRHCGGEVAGAARQAAQDIAWTSDLAGIPNFADGLDVAGHHPQNQDAHASWRMVVWCLSAGSFLTALRSVAFCRKIGLRAAWMSHGAAASAAKIDCASDDGPFQRPMCRRRGGGSIADAVGRAHEAGLRGTMGAGILRRDCAFGPCPAPRRQILPLVDRRVFGTTSRAGSNVRRCSTVRAAEAQLGTRLCSRFGRGSHVCMATLEWRRRLL